MWGRLLCRAVPRCGRRKDEPRTRRARGLEGVRGREIPGRWAAVRASRAHRERKPSAARIRTLPSDCREALRSPRREYSFHKSYLSSSKEAGHPSASLRRNLHKLTAAPRDTKLTFLQDGWQGSEARSKQYLIFFFHSLQDVFISQEGFNRSWQGDLSLFYIYATRLSAVLQAMPIHPFPPRSSLFHCEQIWLGQAQKAEKNRHKKQPAWTAPGAKSRAGGRAWCLPEM